MIECEGCSAPMKSHINSDKRGLDRPDSELALCPNCTQAMMAKLITCTTCDDKKIVIRDVEDGEIGYKEWEPCPECQKGWKPQWRTMAKPEKDANG